MKVETLKIKTDNGPVLINKSDFDESKHELHDETTKKPRGRKKKEDTAE